MNGLQKFQWFHEQSTKFYYANIVGTSYLSTPETQMNPDSFHMILTHIVQQDPTYTEFYKSHPGLKLLDNSLFELGEALSVREIVEAAHKVEADILVSPDVIGDGEATYQNAVDFIHELKMLGMEGKYAIMAVPQGNSVEEWVNCYRKLSNLPDIQCIGLSIIGMITAFKYTTGIEDITDNRIQFSELLSKELVWDDSMWHHLLGLGRGPYELLSYTQMPWIRSNDSSNAWWHGYNGISYKELGKLDFKLKLEVDFQAPFRMDRYSQIANNLEHVKTIVDAINKHRDVWGEEL